MRERICAHVLHRVCVGVCACMCASVCLCLAQVVLRVTRPGDAHTQDTGKGFGEDGGGWGGVTAAHKVLTLLSGGAESLSVETFECVGGESVARCQWEVEILESLCSRIFSRQFYCRSDF